MSLEPPSPIPIMPPSGFDFDDAPGLVEQRFVITGSRVIPDFGNFQFGNGGFTQHWKTGHNGPGTKCRSLQKISTLHK
jgi:hypothetical protein